MNGDDLNVFVFELDSFDVVSLVVLFFKYLLLLLFILLLSLFI